MGRTERLFRITSLLRDVKKIRFSDMLDRLAVSPATLKRDLKYLREQLGTPIEYDAFDRTYRIEGTSHRTRQELPGLWFSEPELLALAFATRLIEEIDPQAKMAPRLDLVIQRIEPLLSREGAQARLLDRVRLVMPGKREVDSQAFDAVATALMQRRRVRLCYRTRSRNSTGQRDVSPQRLVFHKTWYLDAWCHKAGELRRFALDAIESARSLDTPAQEIALAQIERLFDGAYGAFPGEPNRWATLLFSASAAQWVERETWHPMQRRRKLADGSLELVLPYREPTELVMDILRHGDQVEVLGDDSLLATIRNRVRALASRYRQ